MPRTTCTTCNGDYHWTWEEAFDKFGFGDGDGQLMTDHVVTALEAAGYDATTSKWTLHNEIIDSITKDGVALIPPTAKLGYDDPRWYLPEDIVRLLDDRFPVEGEVVA